MKGLYYVENAYRSFYCWNQFFSPDKWKTPMFFFYCSFWMFLFYFFYPPLPLNVYKNSTHVLNVYVLSALSNEINSVKRAVSHNRKFVFLGCVLVSSNEVFWIWYGNIHYRKKKSLLLKFGAFALIFPLCLSVGIWYNLWPNKALESVFKNFLVNFITFIVVQQSSQPTFIAFPSQIEPVCK